MSKFAIVSTWAIGATALVIVAGVTPAKAATMAATSAGGNFSPGGGCANLIS